jgi:hypothetical protein
MSKRVNNKRKGFKNYDEDWDEESRGDKKSKKTRKKHWGEEDELDGEALYFLNKIKKK